MLAVKVHNSKGQTVAAVHGEREVVLPVSRTYEEGDKIIFESFPSEGGAGADRFLVLSVDDAIGPVLVYVKKTVYFKIPFGEQKICYSPKAFAGARHLITARLAEDFEIAAYRNLALNPMDQHGDTGCFPHAEANVETRGEAVFAARNAIDGIHANTSHGEWPFGSWGINRNPEAVIKVDFGRPVTIDRLRIYLRADFPHDNWWKQVSVRFSDDSVETFALTKTGEGQDMVLSEKKTVTWMQLEQLIKSEEESPFPALTQIEAYGTEA